jgi:hypothetical protein
MLASQNWRDSAKNRESLQCGGKVALTLQLVSALGKAKCVTIAWGKKVVIGGYAGFTDKKAATAHKLFSFSMDPNSKGLVGLVPRKLDVHIFDDPAAL